MSPTRRRRCLHRLALFAMLAVLWAQSAAAAHGPVCLVASTTHVDCVDREPAHPHDASSCDAHCHGEQRSETARLPLLAALPAFVVFPLRSEATLGRAHDDPGHSAGGPGARHGPTTHPAAVLLI